MADTHTFTAAVRTHGQTADLKNGSVTVPGVDFEFLDIKPQIAAYRRMVRNVEFDICELASTTYMIARGFGKPFKALPVFFGRRFHHHGLVVRPDSGISTPKDLEGKKVGVRAYTVTTGVWTRGILQNEYGVDPYKVNWMVDDEEHVQELKLPDNVQHVPEDKSLASMMANGEIQAGFLANAGIGREGKPREDWAAKPSYPTDTYRELIPDAEAAEAEWYKRTGILPCHGTIVIKDEVAAKYPDLPRRLYDAFLESKERYLEKVRSGEATEKKDNSVRKMIDLVGPDPMPYGLKANLQSIEALRTYAFQQGLMPTRMPIEDLFYNFD
ncbi:ABC transporter substrate-binding protein [Phyllobacterium lublinensis]|jgi:4,5-dihydroxyphthalate decarboxylase|uniref:ABC transporter substrate-binding protein n=1 Tax=Phyllobacterium lublinensis TaxID=2875708 RepID=UPI001CCA13EB|nr:PhnD/SsuA/transferrin family substrate-binding protein [Phyllobacterium sp. 2063]MBZ9653741.1 PhnD/SsuA/transferrin family substrate-binding protein [Phyllobacterium sp. 2063]